MLCCDTKKCGPRDTQYLMRIARNVAQEAGNQRDPKAFLNRCWDGVVDLGLKLEDQKAFAVQLNAAVNDVSQTPQGLKQLLATTPDDWRQIQTKVRETSQGRGSLSAFADRPSVVGIAVANVMNQPDTSVEAKRRLVEEYERTMGGEKSAGTTLQMKYPETFRRAGKL